MCLISPSNDDTEEVLIQGGAVIIYDEEAGRKDNEIDGHCWGDIDTYAYMSRIRNHLKNEVVNRGADYFFSLDSDIIIPPGTITHLLNLIEEFPGVISPAVNMGIHTTVWNTMSWLNGVVGSPFRPLSGYDNFKRSDVVMAAMFMDKSGMGCDWEAHTKGEDVGYSVNAFKNQVPLWWQPKFICTHLMYR